MGPVVVEEEIDFSSDAESEDEEDEEDEEDKEAAESKTERGDQSRSQDQCRSTTSGVGGKPRVRRGSNRDFDIAQCHSMGRLFESFKKKFPN